MPCFVCESVICVFMCISMCKNAPTCVYVNICTYYGLKFVHWWDEEKKRKLKGDFLCAEVESNCPPLMSPWSQFEPLLARLCLSLINDANT